MSYLLYTILGMLIIIAAFAAWIKISLWIMGLGVTDDNKIDWPWRED